MSVAQRASIHSDRRERRARGTAYVAFQSSRVRRRDDHYRTPSSAAGTRRRRPRRPSRPAPPATLGALGEPARSCPRPPVIPASQCRSASAIRLGRAGQRRFCGTNICSHDRSDGPTMKQAGEGLEPPFPGPKPGVLPARRPPKWMQSTEQGSAGPSAAPLRSEPMAAPFTVLIMAAGQGTRMRSTLPKVLHRVCGKPMVEWVDRCRAGGRRGAGRLRHPPGRRRGRGAAGRASRSPSRPRGRAPAPRCSPRASAHRRHGRRSSSSPAIIRSSPREQLDGAASREHAARAAPPPRCSPPRSSTPPATGASCATGRRRRADRRDEAHRTSRAGGGARDPRDQHRHLRLRRARRCSRRSTRSGSSRGERYLTGVFPVIRGERRHGRRPHDRRRRSPPWASTTAPA